MNRIDRLFGILTLLQSRKYVTAEHIAEKFEISVRTVYRDVKALGETGVPVSFEQGRGYFVVQGYFLPPVSFSSEEANALLLLESIVYGFTDKSIQDHYSTALNKIKSVLKPGQKSKLEELRGTIRWQRPERLENNLANLSVLQNAIANKTQIRFNYINNNGDESRRDAEAIGLVFYAFKWHLIAWCHLRNQYRDFNVVKVTNLLDLGVPFQKADHMDLNDYIKALPVNY